MRDTTLLDLGGGKRLYYYKGNFFYPINLTGDLPGRINGAIRSFMKSNSELVKQDRTAPDFLTISQLCDLKPGEAKNDT